MNNLKQLAWPCTPYHTPTNRCRRGHLRASKPLLSWRVHILPYIEQDALYRHSSSDDLDSDNNKKLIAQMPQCIAPPFKAEKNKTTTWSTDQTIFEGKKAWPSAKITDGTSNTIMIVEAMTAGGHLDQPGRLSIGRRKPMHGWFARAMNGFWPFPRWIGACFRAPIGRRVLRALLRHWRGRGHPD